MDPFCGVGNGCQMTPSQKSSKTIGEHDIYVMILKSNKITVVKYDENDFMVGGHHNTKRSRVAALGKLRTSGVDGVIGTSFSILYGLAVSP